MYLTFVILPVHICPCLCSLQVALFHLVPDKATGVPHWVFLDRKQPHSHDVRTLTALLRPDSDPLLLSGGNDGQVVLYSLERFLKEHPTRQSRSPQRPLLQLACGGLPARLLHAQQRMLSVWELGRAVRSQAPHGGEAGEERALRRLLSNWNFARWWVVAICHVVVMI
jgi:hypothetical protein